MGSSSSIVDTATHKRDQSTIMSQINKFVGAYNDQDKASYTSQPGKGGYSDV